MSADSPRAPAEGHVLLESLVAILLAVTFFIGPLKLLGVGWLSYLLPDALALAILLLLFAGRALRGQPLFARSGLTIPILLLAVLCFLELANPEAPFIRSALGIRTWLLQLGFYFVGFHILRSPRQVGRLYALLLSLGAITALYGIYQWRAGPQQFATWSEDYGRYARFMWSEGSFRAFSTFVFPNVFAGNLGLLMLLALGLTASNRVHAGWRTLAGAVFALMGAGIAASGTRAPLVQLGLAVALGAVMLRPPSRRVKMTVISLMLFGVAFLLVTSTIGTSIAPRFMSILDPTQFLWKWLNPLVGGISVAAAHPFGLGMGYTGGIPQFLARPVFNELPSTVIDSGYGSAAAEMGFLGLALFAYLLVKVALDAVRSWRALEPGRLKDLLLGPALIAVTYPVIGLLGGTHTSFPSSAYTWLLIGMLVKAPVLQKELDADHVSAAPVHAR